MDKNKISIATITWARDDDEENLLKNSLQQLAKLNIPVFITDGGSGENFLNFIRSIPNSILLQPEEKGLWMQAKASLSKAFDFGSDFIFYTEPDKLNFFKNSLPQMIEDIEMDKQSGIFLASRSTNAFSTFPSFQQMTETTINNSCKEIIGKSFDYTYGPFVLNRNLIPHLKNFNPDLGWGWRPYAFIIAKRLGYNIDAYKGDFLCPEDQRNDTPKERIYRMRQLAQNIDGITISATIKLEENNLEG
jgi:hypothetical protein